MIDDLCQSITIMKKSVTVLPITRTAIVVIITIVIITITIVITGITIISQYPPPSSHYNHNLLWPSPSSSRPTSPSITSKGNDPSKPTVPTCIPTYRNLQYGEPTVEKNPTLAQLGFVLGSIELYTNVSLKASDFFSSFVRKKNSLTFLALSISVL